MHDELLMTVIRAGGSRWESLLAKAVALHLRCALDAGDDAFEEVAGRLEDWLLDALCSLRAVNAARGGRGESGEALAEAGESITRLSACLTELRCAALARVPTRSAP
jgi:hypothetical protein